MQQSPPNWPPASPAKAEIPVRGAFLGSILVTGLLGNMVRAGLLFISAASSTGAAKNSQDALDPTTAAAFRHDAQAANLLAFVALANVVFLMGAWMWKKWGALGCGAFMLFGAVVGFHSSPIASFFGLFWLAILGSVVSSKWRYFE